MGGVVVDNGVDDFSHRNLFFDDIEEANELLMAMALRVATDHRAVEDVIAASSVALRADEYRWARR